MHDHDTRGAAADHDLEMNQHNDLESDFEPGEAPVRFAVVYGEHGPSVRHVTDGCRLYECCGGRECGFTLDEVKQELKHYYENVIERIEALDAKSIWSFRP